MMKSTTAYIGLGSNLGDRRAYIKRAIKMLAETKYIQVCSVSDVIETNPLGQVNQPKYLNAVAEIKTSLSAQGLHKTLVGIETALGRARGEKWLPRTIDLDLLLFGQEVVNLPHLTIPHPQMHLRSFVLKGLQQLNPNLLHPVIQESVSELANRLGGCDFVLNPDVPQLISMAGVIGVGKTTLARKLSNLLARRLPATCPPLARHPCGGSVWRVRLAGSAVKSSSNHTIQIHFCRLSMQVKKSWRWIRNYIS